MCLQRLLCLQQALPRAEHAAIVELLQGELEASEAAGTEAAARVAVQEPEEPEETKELK